MTEQTNTPMSISPELLWAVIQKNFVQVAWRRAIPPQKQASTSQNDELGHKAIYPTYNKSKFTGSPAFKELKNLIIVILTSQTSKKGNS